MKGAVITPVRTRGLRLHSGDGDVQGSHHDQEKDGNGQDTPGENGNPGGPRTTFQGDLR